MSAGVVSQWTTTGTLHERPVPFIITPDVLRLRIGRCPAKHTPEHLQGGVDPVLLVDRGRTIALDARDEQDNQDTLATAAEKRSSMDRRLRAPLYHYRINIDRQTSAA